MEAQEALNQMKLFEIRPCVLFSYSIYYQNRWQNCLIRPPNSGLVLWHRKTNPLKKHLIILKMLGSSMGGPPSALAFQLKRFSRIKKVGYTALAAKNQILSHASTKKSWWCKNPDNLFYCFKNLWPGAGIRFKNLVHCAGWKITALALAYRRLDRRRSFRSAGDVGVKSFAVAGYLRMAAKSTVGAARTPVGAFLDPRTGMASSILAPDREKNISIRLARATHFVAGKNPLILGPGCGRPTSGAKSTPSIDSWAVSILSQVHPLKSDARLEPRIKKDTLFVPSGRHRDRLKTMLF